MSPKTRATGKKKKEREPAKTKKPTPEKKKNDAGVKMKRDAAAKKKREAAAKKKREAAAKKKRETAKKKREASKRKSEGTAKKRKRDGCVDGGAVDGGVDGGIDGVIDGGSSSNRTKRARNAETETSSPPNPNDFPATTTPLPSEAGNDANPSTPPPIQSNPENPEQPVNSLSVSSTRSPSQPVCDDEEEIESNNREANAPEAHDDNANVPERTVVDENMTVGPMRPVGFFFQPSEYGKSCKLSSRCHQHDFLKMIEKFDDSEKSWFQNHPQFKHIFHMDCGATRKVMGMWMLLLRTMHTEKGRQAWFGVNGVPVRHSIREHVLLSGLHCHTYPENYPSIGSMKFATKHFKKKEKKTKEKKGKKGKEKGLRVTEMDVEEKLLKMKVDGSDERLKMAVLYFLARVSRGRSKGGYFIEHFILQAVDDLDFVDNFTWSRYTFDDCMKEIFHLRDHFRNGIPEKAQWVFPGFINPLEILAFECIPVLRDAFRDPVSNCLADCPRMCKWKYKRTGTTGYPLDVIYQALGNTKVITSILEPEGEEIDLLYTIMDEGTLEDVELIDDSDTADIVIDSWNQILIQPGGKIFWEDLFEMDVKTRPTEPHQEEERVPVEPEVGGEAAGVAEGEARRERVTELELRLNKRMDDGFALRDETIRLLAARVKELEDERNQRENWSFQYDQYQTGGTSGGDAGVGTPLPTGTTPEGDAGVGTPLPTDTTPEDIIGLVGEEPEKGGETETEKEGETEAEIEADKEGEEGGNKDDEDEPSTLQIMAEAAEKVEKAAAEKAVADNKGEEGEKEDDGGEMQKRVSKRYYLLRSPFTPN
ncbi:hypothetical protein N665_0089s0061 [Sinapis alba]|nr:hypothetical protein N665_0089s0061 [Sinapis alba]